MSKATDPIGEWLNEPGGIAERLRAARLRAGLTGTQLAAAHGWPQSKISKIENGRQAPTPSDIEAWMRDCGADDTEIEQLHALLDDMTSRHQDWRRRMRQGQAKVQAGYNELVRAAAVFREFTLVTVPGLLQTAEYARSPMKGGVVLHGAPADEVDAAVATRMQRQQYLYDQSKRFEFLLSEPVLRFLICPPDVVLGQLDRLLAVVTGLPNVRFGILPMEARLATIPQNSFVLIDDTAYVETFVGETVHTGAEAAAYSRVMDLLWNDAVTGDEARALIMRAVQAVQQIAEEQRA